MKNFITLVILIGVGFYAGYAYSTRSLNVFKPVAKNEPILAENANLNKLTGAENQPYQDYKPSKIESFLGQIIGVKPTEDEKIDPSGRINIELSYGKSAILSVPTSLETVTYKFVNYSNVKAFDTEFAKNQSFWARNNIYPKAFINENLILAVQEDRAELKPNNLNENVLLVTDTTGKVTKNLKTLGKAVTVSKTEISDDLMTIYTQDYNEKPSETLKLNIKTLKLQ